MYSEFASDTKPSGEADIWESHLQEDLDRVEKWTNKKHMRFNEHKPEL